MPAPLDVRPNGGGAPSVVTIDAAGNEKIAGRLEVAAGLLLDQQSTAPLQTPGALTLYTLDGKNLVGIGADGLPITVQADGTVDWFNAKAFGATGNGTTDDTAALNAALAAANAQGGGVVFLPWGTYLVSSTISIPPFVMLVGETQVSLNVFTTPGSISRIVAAASWAPSSSTGIVSIMSKTPGGWSTNTASCGLSNVFIDGSQNASTNLNGLNLVGPVYDVHLQDVFIWKAPHNGINAAGQTESGITPTFPYHQRYTRVSAVTSANSGFNLVNFTDSTFDNCLAFGSVGNNYTLQNNSNSVFTQCRAEWSSSGRGFDITGSSSAIVFTGCTTDQNNGEGLRIHAATGQSTQGGGITWTGGKLHADGGGGVNNNGIKITASTAPIIISGTNIEAGQNPNNLNFFPANAIAIDTSADITISACMLQGTTAGWSDGGGNTNLTRSGCIAATGNPNTQSFAQLADLPLIPNPNPADQSLIAWSYDPVIAAGNASATSGTLFLIKIYVRQAATLSKGLIQIVGAAVTPTANQNFLGLYDSGGTLRASTTAGAIDTATTAANTLLTGAFSTPYAAAAGFYWLGILLNAATPATVMRGGTAGSPGFADMGNTAANDRFAVNGTALTALPNTITPSSNTHSGAAAFWAGVQ